MKGPTSPFEIPLIVDLISRDLSKKDIVNCILVNSDFHTQFKGHHWHEVKISADKQRYRNKGFSLEYQKAVLENGHLIRKLSIRGELFRNVLELIASSPCENLSEIIYTGRGLHQRLEFDSIIGLISKNTSLRSLSLTFRCSRPAKSYRRRLAVALSNLPSLTRLCLVDDDDGATPLEYETLLTCLPRNLQHLKLDWNVAWEVDADEEDDHDNGDNEGYLEGEEDEKDEDKDTGNDDEKPPSNDFEWQEKYSHLKSVDMVVKLSGCEDTTLFPFLQRCPALEEVKIVQASYSIFKEVIVLLSNTRLFPILTKVSVGNFVIESTSGLSLISGMTGRISAFLAENMTIQPSSLFIGALTTQWAETLETFSIESTTITSGLIAWRDIQDENDGPNWACLELEDLEIRFLDVRNRNYGQNEEMNTIAGINRAYKQIGRLSRLQRLRLGWHPNQPTSHQAKLDMSITSGLRQMEGLKELRELDITYINEVNIGQDEVEFMVESWPKLRRIKGLLELNLSKFPAEDENIVTSNTELGECPACIQWLLQQKQFISIT
ncbi:hypothetical protein BGZ79_008525 [Entomortierella chlamydospora]|nr:hypothetical protein BGZ79_008525 [Entomortierella chlamydospora]